MSRLEKLKTPAQLRAVLDVSEVILWAVILGTASLLAAVGSFGFSRSRRTGWVVLGFAVAAAFAFVKCAIALANAT